MSPEAVPIPDPVPEGMGALSRVTGVFFEPGKTFEDIGRRPSWLLPLLLVILATVAFHAMYGQRVGYERFLRQQIATNAKVAQRMEQIPAERREESIAMQAKITGIGYMAGPVVMMPIMLIISAGILLGITAMMSAGLRFKQVYAVICFAALPGAIKYLLAMVVLFLKNPDDFNLQNPLAFNVAAFMDPLTSSKFLYTIGAAFDLFAIWTILLTAIGLSAAAGKRKLSFGSALIAVLIPWVVLVGFGATMASMFG